MKGMAKGREAGIKGIGDSRDRRRKEERYQGEGGT